MQSPSGRGPISLVVALFLLLCGSGCYRVTPEEEKIIGTWEFTGVDATGRVVFRRDHVVVDLFPEHGRSNARWIPLAAGRWRLEGSDILTEEKTLPLRYMPSPTSRITRIPIREFQQDKLDRGDERSPFIRVTGGAELYAEILAWLYVGASLIALLASIYAIRCSPFRAVFSLLVIAALAALAYSSMLLAAELAQTGSLIIAPGWLDALKLPREILKFVWIVIAAVAFARLAFLLRAKTPARSS